MINPHNHKPPAPSRRPIREIPPELINQIAAGEVVERPASVVKELLENAIDAGASSISVHIERGGQALISVTDNGCGIPAGELEIAVSRHATSKIYALEDLNAISSFGFRGEALPSIASVSRLKITSLAAGAGEAAFVEINGGKIVGKGPAASRPGTGIEVRDLFFNVPARLKFLKTVPSEAKRCLEVFIRTALAGHGIGFEFVSGGKSQLKFTREQKLLDKLRLIWPPSMTDALCPVNFQREDISVQGYVGGTDTAQARADRIYLYVNGRPVQDKLLLRALRDAYQGRILSREYPQAVLFITIDPQEVDVNVHPAKSEVRFRDEGLIFSVTRMAVNRSLTEKLQKMTDRHQPEENPIYDRRKDDVRSPGYASFRDYEKELGSAGTSDYPVYRDKRPEAETQAKSAETGPVASIDTPVEQKHGAYPLPGDEPFYNRKDQSLTPPRNDETENPSGRLPTVAKLTSGDISVTREEETIHEVKDYPAGQKEAVAGPLKPAGRPLFLGVISDTYLVLSFGDNSLVLLDQHAAHERVIYERLRSKGTSPDIRTLLVPLEMPLHPSEFEFLNELWEEMRSLGFILETRGPKLLSVSGTPSSLDASGAREYLRAALSGRSKSLKDLWISLACKTAIKAGEPLAPAEAMALVETWMKCPDREYCPHGRPTFITWTKDALEKLFKRTG